MSVRVQCKICKKTPDQLSEYKYKGEDPVEFVKQHEGTYNENTGKFYCTSCYIKVGMPMGKA